MKTVNLENIKKLMVSLAKLFTMELVLLKSMSMILTADKTSIISLIKPVKQIQKLLLFVQETQLFVQVELVKL